MLNPDYLEKPLQDSLPKFKVKIVRRKSTDDSRSENFFFNSLNFFQQRKNTNIPKIEILYQDFENNYLPFKKSEATESRPSTSPISAILKNNHFEITTAKQKKLKIKDLPNLNKKQMVKRENFVITGNSLKCYDWISSFLSISPELKLPSNLTKIKRLQHSGTPMHSSKMNKIMKKRLIKGRCLISSGIDR